MTLPVTEVEYKGVTYPVAWRTKADGTFQVKNWFSNMTPCTIVYNGVTFASTEHAYQYAKYVDPEKRLKILQAPHGVVAKRLAKKWPVETQNWDQICVQVMWDINVLKWSQPGFKAQLLNGPASILELNNWMDFKWGIPITPEGKVYEGQDLLGRVLTSIRKQMIEHPDRIPIKPHDLEYVPKPKPLSAQMEMF